MPPASIIREEMAAEFGNDAKRFMTYIREQEAKNPRTFVDWPAVKPKPMAYPYPHEVQGAPAMVVAEERVEYEAK
jgi:hypothetical protein